MQYFTAQIFRFIFNWTAHYLTHILGKRFMLDVGNGKGYAYPKTDAQAIATDGTSVMWA